VRSSTCARTWYACKISGSSLGSYAPTSCRHLVSLRILNPASMSSACFFRACASSENFKRNSINAMYTRTCTHIHTNAHLYAYTVRKKIQMYTLIRSLQLFANSSWSAVLGVAFVVPLCAAFCIPGVSRFMSIYQAGFISSNRASKQSTVSLSSSRSYDSRSLQYCRAGLSGISTKAAASNGMALGGLRPAGLTFSARCLRPSKCISRSRALQSLYSYRMRACVCVHVYV